jgi:hypothetical protein
MSSPYICSPHSYQLQAAGVLQIHLKEREGRITYWRGATQLVVKTDEVNGLPRRHLVVFSLFSNMPDDIVENLPVSYYDSIALVDERFKQIYESKDWEKYFEEEPNELKLALETAMKKNDIAVLHKFISLLPNTDPTDPLRLDLSNYLNVSLKNIGELDGENQLLLLNMYDNFFDPDRHKDEAMLHLISFSLPKLKTVDHIKAVFEMKFASKKGILQTFAMFRIGDFKHNPGAQLSLLKMLHALPAEYYADKRAVFDYLRNNQENIAEKSRRFLLVTPESDLETKVKP